ncbi:MAG TPA: pantoate--beta-alanine ligase, partial [Sphingomicrobium sp.]|nr:pantoate--beta-alanine ligase [Sphingomicrobium sp.]
MQIIREIDELASALQPWREARQRIALVPTMGALHAGHMALVDAARSEADRPAGRDEGVPAASADTPNTRRARYFD